MKNPRFSRWRTSRKYFQEVWGQLVLRGLKDRRGLLIDAVGKGSFKGCTYHELYSLYRQVLRQKPRYVLELGAGVSTAVLALAVRDLRRAGVRSELISMEEDPEYWEELGERLPPDLKNHVDLRLSPLEDVPYRGGIARCYRDKPDHPYTYVFIDGPHIPSWSEDMRYFDGDILDVLCRQESPVIAHLDCRHTTRFAIERMVPKAQIRYDRLHKFSRIVFPQGSFSEEAKAEWVTRSSPRAPQDLSTRN